MKLLKRDGDNERVWIGGGGFTLVETYSVERGANYVLSGFGKTAHAKGWHIIDESEIYDRVFLPMKAAIENSVGGGDESE